MALKSPLLQLPGELRNMIYREVAKEDIKVCLVKASGINVSHALALVCRQIEAEFLPILEAEHPGVANSVIPATVNKFLVDLVSIGSSKLSAKNIMISEHAAKNGICDLRVLYIRVSAA